MMKRIAIMWLLLLVTGSAAHAADHITPSKTIVRKEVKASGFTQLLTVTAIDIVYTPSSKTRVVIEAPDNVMPYVSVTVSGDKLTASFNRKSLSFKGNPGCKLLVEAPDVRSFTTTSAGSITVAGTIDLPGTVRMSTNSAGAINARKVVCDDFAAEVNSAGAITVENLSAIAVNVSTSSAGDINVRKVKADNIKCVSSSAGKINISGSCQSVRLIANSAGDINAEGLKAASVNAVANSVGNIKCYVTDTFEAQCNSLGKIRYKGTPSVYRAGTKGISKL